MVKNIPIVIGQGSYGCVIKPSLKCAQSINIKYKNKVSKILSNDNARTELDEYSRISNVDKNNEFYLGKPNNCKIKKSDENKNAIKDCNIGDEVLENINDYRLIIMEDGGVNIEMMVNKLKYQQKTLENTQKCELFLLESLRLFAGLIKFKEFNVIHHDLKPQNIVYNEKTNRSNYIDFGMMETKTNVLDLSKKNENSLSIFHWSYPWDAKYLNKKEFEKLKNMSYEKRYELSNKLYENFTNVSSPNHTAQQMQTFFWFVKDRSMYNEDLLLYFRDYEEFLLNQIENISYDEYAEKCADTIDSFGLGFTMMHWLINVKQFLNDDLVSDLNLLFYEMITPNISGRIRIEEATHQLERILSYNHLLQKHRVKIINHKIEPITKEEKTNDKMLLQKIKKVKMNKHPNRDIIDGIPIGCEIGKERNPETNRCVKICKDGYTRNNKFNCIKIKTIKKIKTPLSNDKKKECDIGKERNPETNRCVKVCKDGYTRNIKFNCIKNKTVKNK